MLWGIISNCERQLYRITLPNICLPYFTAIDDMQTIISEL